MTRLLSTVSALLELSSLLPTVKLITGVSLMRSSQATMVLTASVMIWKPL